MTRRSVTQAHALASMQVSPIAPTFSRANHRLATAQPHAAGRSEQDDLVGLSQAMCGQIARDNHRAVRVLLADGVRLILVALTKLLGEAGDIEVVAEAVSGYAAVALVREVRPDVAVMNACLPGLDGVGATRRITADPELSGVEVLILSEDGRDEVVFDALRSGASGFLTRDCEPAELLRAVRVLAGGGAELSPRVTRRLIEEVVSAPSPRRPVPGLVERLTAREREVVTLVALGLTNCEIARRLVVSPATAKSHVSHAMLKLHARDRAQLVALAHQAGFAHPSW
jgi:DNA-binding NarL/FixJ family response regulator